MHLVMHLVRNGWLEMMKRVFIVMVLLLMIAGQVAAQSTKVLNFDAYIPGVMPDGFTSVIGEWKVVADGDAPSKPNAPAQLAKNSGSTFNLILVNGTNQKDVDISVKLKAIAGGEDQGGGLVWRAKDQTNYYVARYNPLEDNYRVYKVVNARRSELQSATIRHSDGWHTLRVEMVGDHIQCYYDGKKELDVKDTTFKESGQIGLWSKSDAQSHFDDLTLK
jgi:hypothetical protein